MANYQLGLLYADRDFHGFSMEKAKRHLREAWTKGHPLALPKVGGLFQQAEKQEEFYLEVHNSGQGWGRPRSTFSARSSPAQERQA